MSQPLCDPSSFKPIPRLDRNAPTSMPARPNPAFKRDALKRAPYFYYKGFPVIATDLTIISSLFSFFHIHSFAGVQ
jgi:hypothetical protein